MDIQELIQTTISSNASDLHLSKGNPPIIRVDGELQRVNQNIIDDAAMQLVFDTVMTEHQKQLFKEKLELDFAYAASENARFRVNAYHHARGCGAAFRTIPTTVPTLEELGLPQIFKDVCEHRNGLILVTGPTGSGKSTTLAAMIDYLNTIKNSHILTIEDPIEFTHQSKNCLINQREVNRDTMSFHAALRSALREDPDIILVGELRDLETIRLALTAAETGHLVMATLHTNSAAKTIDRIIDVFPGDEQAMIRSMLSESLRAIFAQTLLKRKNSGRVAAQEILVSTPAVRNLIRENKVPQLYSTIQTNQSAGMRTIEQHVQELIAQNVVSTDYNRVFQLQD